MSRDTKIRLSEREKDSLDTVRDDMYGTDEVPYGEVVDDLIDLYWRDD